MTKLAGKAAAMDGEKTREALAACIKALEGLEPEESRRVTRTLAVWFEDEVDRADRAERILEALTEIGAAVRGE